MPALEARPVERSSDQNADAPFYTSPDYACSVTTVRLPSVTKAEQWSSKPSYDTVLFGRHYHRAWELRDGSIRMVSASRIEQPEIEAAVARRDNARIASFGNSMGWITYNPLGRKAAVGNGETVPTTLARLDAFKHLSGRAHAGGRNTDNGPTHEPTTSALSPYLRRRLLIKTEVVAAAVDVHGHQGAERFVQEVFWRTYFKGHLKTRPSIWADYRRQVADQHERLRANSGLRHAHAAAVEGRTGIEGFDEWAREMAEQGWLHNHARMWFASIWIFTLRLPWQLGADLFMRNLLDGDPASNTLSWRWVAGLHTRGKAYAARAENIARYTDARFHPTGLNEDSQALTDEADHPLVPLAPVGFLPKGDVALLLHLDDLHPESLDLGGAHVRKVAGYLAHADGATERVRAADRDAMADALARAATYFGSEAALADDSWAGDLPVVAAWAPVGPSAAALPRYARVRRDWDERAWPRSTRDFFQLRSAIPQLLDAAGLR